MSYVFYFFHNLSNFLVAPLYLHFGNTSLFIEICVLFNSITDTTFLFFSVFFLIIFISFYRNYLFQVFSTNLFKNYSYYVNFLPTLIYFSNFFNSFLKLISYLNNKFLLFIKKRK